MTLKKENQNLYDYWLKNKISIKKNFIEKINGEFLLVIFNQRKNFFYLINDRFTSIPLYYVYNNHTLYFSNNYLYLYKKLKKKNFIKIKFIIVY